MSKKQEAKVVQTGFDPEVMAVIGGIGKKYGDKNTVMVLGEASGCIGDKGLVSTGSVCIDRAIGVFCKDGEDIKHGVPRGRIVDIYGQESSGKTTLLDHMIAETQRNGKLAAIIDMEQTWDPTYAASIGVDVKNLVFSQPSYAEQALDILDSLLRTGKFGIICLDSVAALVPQKELEGEMGESSMGVVARLMSQAMRKINGIVNKTDTIVVFTNQIREKIGVIYGSSIALPGGNALKFYASIRIEIKKIGLLKNGTGDVFGNRCKVTIIKNKVAPPLKSCEFDVLYGVGIDKYGEMIDLASDFGIIQKKGAWFAYGEESIGQGRSATAEFLKKNEEVYDTIRSEVLTNIYNEVNKHEAAEEDSVSSSSEEECVEVTPENL